LVDCSRPVLLLYHILRRSVGQKSIFVSFFQPSASKRALAPTPAISTLQHLSAIRLADLSASGGFGGIGGHGIVVARINAGRAQAKDN
jgi:hypothetical protein